MHRPVKAQFSASSSTSSAWRCPDRWPRLGSPGRHHQQRLAIADTVASRPSRRHPSPLHQWRPNRPEPIPLVGATGAGMSSDAGPTVGARTDWVRRVAPSNTTPTSDRVESSVRASWFHRAPRVRPLEQRAANCCTLRAGRTADVPCWASSSSSPAEGGGFRGGERNVFVVHLWLSPPPEPRRGKGNGTPLAGARGAARGGVFRGEPRRARGLG